MEKAADWEQNGDLLIQLTEGKELAEQLRNHHLSTSSPPETCQFILQKILSSYDKALSMLNWGASLGETMPMAHVLEESPHFLVNSSPRTDDSDRDSDGQFRKDVYKKRKMQPRWTEQVKVCSGTGVEGPLDDGHSWRKYGRKIILGASFPRGYYRCTHRHSQGCLAIKQVQRSDQDPAMFEVTYKGRHTCSQAKVSVPNEGSKHVLDSCQIEQLTDDKPAEPFNNLGEGLKVKTDNLEAREGIIPSFSFPSTSIENENSGNNIFVESTVGNNILGSLSLPSAFLSPIAPDPNYLSMSPYHMDNFGIAHSSYTSESDLTEIVPALTSFTDLPMGDFEITIDNVEFDKLFAEILAEQNLSC